MILNAESLSRALSRGEIHITRQEVTTGHEEFMRMRLEGVMPVFGLEESRKFLNGLIAEPFDKKTRSHHHMKDPNNNAAVHEVARDLVKTEVSIARNEGKIADAREAREAARIAVADAEKDVERIMREAQEESAKLLATARGAFGDASNRLRSLEEKSKELTAIRESGKAALVVARSASTEDIELAVGKRVVRAFKVDGGAIKVTCSVPAKAPRLVTAS